MKRKFSFPIPVLFLGFLLICLGSCDPNDDEGNGIDVEELQIFPPDNPWNTDISQYPVHSNSDHFIASIGLDQGIHPDFGTTWEGVPNGIPYVAVIGSQSMVPIFFTLYPDESDPGPYPVPDDAPVEGGIDSTGDRHVLVLDKENLVLYELYRAFKIDEGWEAGCGAKWDLTSNLVRPKYWTSADAAGLPIFSGLVRYGEILTGEIDHALRFTVGQTQRGFIYPARHFASSSNNPNLPPMGLRLRLKSDVDISGFSETNQIILRALKKYGMLVADNGGDWFISGSPDSRWDDEDLSQLSKIQGKDFEVVYTREIEYEEHVVLIN